MIDLDELEARIVSEDKDPGYDYILEEEALALVQVVRVAERFLDHVDREACLGADGECQPRGCAEGKALIEALAPFGWGVAA